MKAKAIGGDYFCITLYFLEDRERCDQSDTKDE